MGIVTNCPRVLPAGAAELLAARCMALMLMAAGRLLRFCCLSAASESVVIRCCRDEVHERNVGLRYMQSTRTRRS